MNKCRHEDDKNESITPECGLRFILVIEISGRKTTNRFCESAKPDKVARDIMPPASCRTRKLDAVPHDVEGGDVQRPIRIEYAVPRDRPISISTGQQYSVMINRRAEEIENTVSRYHER